MKPYRSIDFNDERKWKSKHPLDDIYQVGIQKSMGYVRYSSEINLEKLHLSNSKLIFFKKGAVNTLWVGDIAMMQLILDSNKETLINNAWSIQASEVFDRICKHDVRHHENNILYHLITDLFNSWCLWCETPVWSEQSTEPSSKKPHDSGI
jgi:hypothetical protein